MSMETNVELLLKGQADLAATVAEQHKAQSDALKGLIDEHEKRMHPKMEPDHTEQHKRYGGWLRRIDGAWDTMARDIGRFILLVLAVGVATIIQSKFGS